MDEDELNDDILRLHGYTSEEDSDDGGKTELDDFYYYHKPPPIDIDPNKHNIITTGVTKIPKNQLRRLRKKFANVENNTDKSEVGTTDLQLNEASNLTENHTPQLLSKSQKKRLRRKKKLVNGADCVTQPEEEENPDDGGTKRSIPEGCFLSMLDCLNTCPYLIYCDNSNSRKFLLFRQMYLNGDIPNNLRVKNRKKIKLIKQSVLKH
ncbi:uncharacterized protein LOC123011366 [Tribolium madens]|uniref:uncharacterized protein LOC123011366 n=1 Tax=Tribolium madens TaxID=41895 RepID=UPI001CF7639C|nr:uncharacterized protein LOC123011366 [Tribolium madens]